MVKTALSYLLLISCTVIALAISGCVCGNFGGNSGVPSPTPEPTEVPMITLPTEVPLVPTYAVFPGSTTSGQPAATTKPVATSTPVATITPVTGIINGTLTGYGTDKDTYSRGDNATCYVDVKNTGTATIERVDFKVNVYRSAFGMMIRAINNQIYSVDQQGITPGTTKRVEITVQIPAEYQGMSTAGNYRFDIDVSAGGKVIGNFSKDVKVV